MNVGLLYQPLVPAARPTAEALARFLEERGHGAELLSLLEPPLARLPDGVDLVVTFGGDGSILRSTHLAAAVGVPIVGVNLGRVGFLAEVSPESLPHGIIPYLEGEVAVEERALVEATVKDGERSWVNLQEPPSPATLPLLALNEVFVGRGAIGRLVRLSVTIDGHWLGDFRADGVMVSTPTGSTAYGLAAGGPVVAPDVAGLIVVAVSAQANPVRSLVIPSSATVEITVQADHPPVLSGDGLFDVALESGDTVVVASSRHRARFLRRDPQAAFYRDLVQRLR